MIKTKLFCYFSFLGLATLPLPAMSQVTTTPAPPVILPATVGGGGITAAASFTNQNDSVSTIAVQSTFPSSVYAREATATLTGIQGTVGGNNVILTGLTVSGSRFVTPTASATVESIAAGKLNGAASLSDQVSLIRAWRSGGID